jgi:hypothetical protein
LVSRGTLLEGMLGHDKKAWPYGATGRPTEDGWKLS